jgi:hypothetical protein
MVDGARNEESDVIKYDCGWQSLKGYGLVYGSGDGSRDLEDYGIRDHHLL